MRSHSGFTLINFETEGAYINSKYYRPKFYYDRRVDVEACHTDEEDLDQLVIRYGPVVQILRINPSRKKKARNVCETLEPQLTNDVKWSPLGSYLVSLDKDMATLWGLFGRPPSPILMHFMHPMVDRVDFSPGEKYLVTYNRPDPPIKSELQIFDVETGRVLMGGYDGDVSWPVIRWAGGKDDSYFAMLSENTVSVYETEKFNLLDKKYYDVVDMCWSPAESILALLRRCGKVSFVHFPEMVELGEKDIIGDVHDCNMYWQSNGEYLAVILGPVIVLFRIKEVGFPSEVLEVGKNIIAFAWEPSSYRFAMIHDDQSMPVVSFYTMQTPRVSVVTAFNNQADSLFWSPRGNYIVLAQLKLSQFEFFDVDELVSMKKVEHLKANHIAWDPTGRFVVAASTISQEMEEGFKEGFDWFYPPPYPDNGFYLLSFKGDEIYRKSTAKEFRLLQIDWRPYGEIIDEDMLKDLEKQESDNSSSEEECEPHMPPPSLSSEEEGDSDCG